MTTNQIKAWKTCQVGEGCQSGIGMSRPLAKEPCQEGTPVMTAYPVSKRVNIPSIDVPELINPL